MVDVSGDILAAWAENRRMTALARVADWSPDGRAALESWLLPLARSGSPLPAVRHKGTTLAAIFIAATTGTSLAQVDAFQGQHGLAGLAAGRPGPCPVAITVTGQAGGHPWREHMDFGEVAELMRHLGTAAAIICLYLTGMRPQEVQGLRTGCCPDPEPGPDGSPGRHLIRGRHYQLAEIVTEGSTGYTAPPADPRSLAAAISRALAATPGQRLGLLAAGRHLTAARYDYQANIAAFLTRLAPWAATADQST